MSLFCRLRERERERERAGKSRKIIEERAIGMKIGEIN